MASRVGSDAAQGGGFRIEGRVQLEDMVSFPKDQKLMVYALSSQGQPLGAASLDPQGNFRFAAPLRQAVDVDIFVGPETDPQQIRSSSAYRRHFSAKDWSGEGSNRRLQVDFSIGKSIWFPWLPVRICVSGHVRKVSDGEVCPVPYVKVEIFDVDRESCWWPFIRRWWDDLLDRPVIRIPDLLKDRPIPHPFPEPDPVPDPIGPISRFGAAHVADRALGEEVSLNPQPLPPRASDMVGLNPQPEPPSLPQAFMARQGGFSQVGETRLLSPALAARLQQLTITAKIPPWVIFPGCFYSRDLVCETTTDYNGFFTCCFNWWPFHVRRGRLRFDSRPDIIVRITQTINGVDTVIYMDPYTSTRWDSNGAHIDLWLDNPEVECGSGDNPGRPAGSQVFFTRIGDDEVYRINQVSGFYQAPPLVNVAYGSSLLVYGQFGDNLASGAPLRYYRLSYAEQGSSNFKPITADLSDTRVDKVTNFSEDHYLGPLTVNGVPALYEVRNSDDYLWYNPDWLGTWHTLGAEDDTGTYILRLEVFDQNGNKLTSAQVDYRDGTVTPPAVLPPMADRCDVVITLDNKGPQLTLDIPSVINECGVIPWSPSLVLNFSISASQENGRLRSYGLQYTKGVNPTVHVLDSGISNSGAPGTVNKTVSGAALLVGLTTTCAFALKLWAYAHIRDGRQFIYYDEVIKAIAVEKCS